MDHMASAAIKSKPTQEVTDERPRCAWLAISPPLQNYVYVYSL